MDGTGIIAAVVGGYLLGSIPFSYLVARLAAGVDLRAIGTGTVSGSGVWYAAGFLPVAVAGVADIGKGIAAVVPMAGSRPGVAAIAAGSAVVGHNWSVFVRLAGGRGLAPALGALLVLAWEGTVVLGLGLALGRLVGKTGVGSFVAQAALPVVLAVTRGWQGVALAVALVVPMWVKRLAGNARPTPGTPLFRVLLHRLTHDADPPR